ncbi:hypothetical protein [Saccharothrix australiensis]|uniref:DUF4383 domain-containing protein n=1 Tax=Saccharothrix australiensis TaxID=2072 RepID=A0A495W676_9PSEU|nr:hypothetical protein [Saccharothrix australiensis]RKT56577.1 hypothetical protein C8E97_5280 [Saccharothrix australiensis]
MADLSWPQRAALALGALLVVWAVADLVAGRAQLGVLHVATGLVVLAAAFRVRAARFAGTVLGVVFLVVFAYATSDTGGPLNAGPLGNGVHLLLGFTSVALALGCVRCEQRAARPHGRRAGRLP